MNEMNEHETKAPLAPSKTGSDRPIIPFWRARLSEDQILDICNDISEGT